MPATLAIIFLLLVMAFHSLADSLLIMLSVPFALVGGVFLQYLLGYSMTTAVIIGYIALFAVAIQTGIIMIIFIRQALANRRPGQSYMDAVVDGSVLRLRPKLLRELRPGSRVVSHQFDMGDWRPERSFEVAVAGASRRVFLWRVPEPVRP